MILEKKKYRKCLRFDSRKALRCANLLRQVYHFLYILKEKKQPGRSNKAVTLWASGLPNESDSLVSTSEKRMI